MRQFSIDGTGLHQNLSFANKDLPSLSALPSDGRSWRIDWFGDLAFPNRTIRRTQPSLLVHLSRVLDTNFRDDPSVLLSPDSTSPARFQRKVWVSGGTLPPLRIGDSWCNGKLELSPDYQLENFAGLRIDDTSVHLIKAGLHLDDNGFLLPLSEHPSHLQCTHSYCVMVDLPGNRRIIITLKPELRPERRNAPEMQQILESQRRATHCGRASPCLSAWFCRFCTKPLPWPP